MASGPIHYAAPEGKFEFSDREEDQGDDQGQSAHHEEVNHGALEAEEVRETYDHDPPGYQDDPEDSRQSVIGV